jgi:peptide/nickel transport system permease protein
MSAYLIRRVIQGMIVLLASSFVIFSLLYLVPGGPMSEIMEQKRQSARFPVNPADIERLKKQYDLDLPLWQQYTRWMIGFPVRDDRDARYGVLRGDFGESWKLSEHEPAGRVLMRVLPNTLKLMITSTILALAVAVPIGIYSAIHQYSKADYIVTTGTFFGIAMPSFWLGTMMILLFSFMFKDWGLPYLPAGSVTASRAYVVPMLGLIQPESAMDQFLHMILPTLTLSLLSMASWSRFTRSSMLEVLRQDYVRTARAKGLAEKIVISRHALRNALIPLVTIVTLSIPALFGGAIIIETIFNWRGMGRIFFDSLSQGDWPVALAFLMIEAVLYVVASLVNDVLYTVVDPRIRFS